MGEDDVRKCYIDNWHHAGEAMIVDDSGLHLSVLDKTYHGVSSDGKVTWTHAVVVV